MKPAPFRYFAPRELSEALELMTSFGPTQKVLAGGQSLVPLMNMRLARPEQLIDLNRIQGLTFIRDHDGYVCVGAMTRHAELERSGIVREALPLLSLAVPYIGHLAIRNRGTLGGTVSHADPSAEIPAVLVAHGGEVVVRSVRGERIIPVEEFFVSFLTTSLLEDEVVTEVRFARMPERTGWGFAEVARRHGDFALVSVAVMLRLARGEVADIRIVVGSVADRPYRADDAESRLLGSTFDEDVIAIAVESVREEIQPSADAHASADYRRHVACVLTRRCLVAATDRNGHR